VGIDHVPDVQFQAGNDVVKDAILGRGQVDAAGNEGPNELPALPLDQGRSWKMTADQLGCRLAPQSLRDQRQWRRLLL
jgi:hypothetical protein